jgi:hypothetical protein
VGVRFAVNILIVCGRFARALKHGCENRSGFE